MLSIGDLQLTTLLLYVWLLGCVAWGRPRLSHVLPSGSGRGTSSGVGFPWALEALWLASVAVVVLFPIVALLARSIAHADGLAVRFPGDEVAQAIGVALVLVAGALVGWSFRALGRFATVKIRLAPDHAIIRSGPYRWIRHPMYSANMLLSTGIALVFLSLPLLVPVAVIVVLSFVRARAEESLFLGAPALRREYSAYRAESGRFVPLLRGRSRRTG